MASKRKIRRKSCGNKTKHRTKEDAIIEAKNFSNRTHVLLDIYKCRFCSHWHVGHGRE